MSEEIVPPLVENEKKEFNVKMLTTPIPRNLREITGNRKREKDCFEYTITIDRDKPLVW